MRSMRFMVLASLAVFVLFSAIPGFSEKDAVESTWAAQPLKIDGLNDDWTGTALAIEKSTKVAYALKNDGQNLYVLFVFNDPKSLSTIDRTGITFYFSREGKKDKDSGIHFIRKMVKPDELIATLEKQGETLTEEQKQSIRSKPALILFDAERMGKKGEESPEEALPQGTLRAGFRTSNKDGDVIYEFRVPLAEVETSAGAGGAEPGQNIRIGFEWGGLTEQMRQAMNARARGDLGRGLGGESRAGDVIATRPQEGGAPGSGNMIVPKRQSFWTDVKLAKGQ
jgi:hypothetical protein